MRPMKHRSLKRAAEIIERLAGLSAHENIGACRHDLIEAHYYIREADDKLVKRKPKATQPGDTKE